MDGDLITIKSGKIDVPNYPIIPFIEGDGIGPDIWKVTQRIIDSAIQKYMEVRGKFIGLKYWLGKSFQ